MDQFLGPRLFKKHFPDVAARWDQLCWHRAPLKLSTPQTVFQNSKKNFCKKTLFLADLDFILGFFNPGFVELGAFLGVGPREDICLASNSTHIDRDIFFNFEPGSGLGPVLSLFWTILDRLTHLLGSRVPDRGLW